MLRVGRAGRFPARSIQFKQPRGGRDKDAPRVEVDILHKFGHGGKEDFMPRSPAGIAGGIFALPVGADAPDFLPGGEKHIRPGQGRKEKTA